LCFLLLVGGAHPVGAEPQVADHSVSRVDSPNLRVTFLDVGQGDCILLRTREKTILIDAGSDLDNAAQWSIIPYLQDNNIQRIDVAVITHAHRDHFGGFLQLLDAVEFGEFVYSTESMVVLPTDEQANKGDDILYKRLFATIRARGIPLRKAVLGDEFDWGGQVHVDLLHADNPMFPTNINPNDRSLVFKVTTGKVAYMFTGDAQEYAENRMLREFKSKLKADVLKVGHHGSRTATTKPWLEAVRPKHAVISVGIANSYHHPHPDVMQRLASAAVNVVRTDEVGTIESSTDGKTVTVDGVAPRSVTGRIARLLHAEQTAACVPAELAAARAEVLHRLVVDSLTNAVALGQIDIVEHALAGKKSAAINAVKHSLAETLRFRAVHQESVHGEQELLQTLQH